MSEKMRFGLIVFGGGILAGLTFQIARMIG